MSKILNSSEFAFFFSKMNSDIHPDLVFAILKAGSSINIPERITQDIDEILDSVSFPRYTQSELKAIQLKIEEGKQSLFDILTEYSFNFPFLNTLLEKIVTVDKNDEIWDFLSLAVLHSFIAWNNLLTFQKSMPPVTSLLRAMIFILKSYQINFLCNSHMLTQNEIYTSKSALSKIKPIKIIAKNNPRNNQPIEINSSHNYLVKLIVYSFVFAIKIFISHASEAEMYSTADDIIEFSKIVHSPELILFYLNGFWNFSSFFTNQNFFNFISNISKVSAQFEDENLPDLIISENDSIDIILGITSNNTNNNSINRYFNETQTNSLLMTLRNFIIQLEPSSLNLMAVIAKPLSPEIGKLIIPHIGKTIEPLILTNKPFELPIPDQTYVTFTKFENYNIPLDFPVIDSFPNGFNPKNACVYFPDPISIEHLFNENVLNIVSNIALIIGNNMNFCEALIDSFNESLEMHKETQFYGSIYAILIFIVYQIYRKFPQISFPSKICIKLYNEKIFHPGITVFHETNNYSIINTLRSLALELILNDSKNENEETNFYMKEKSNNLAKSNANEISANENEIVNVEENEENNTCAINNILVDAFCPHPLLLAEVFQRLSENVSLFYHKIQKYPQLIDTLIQIAINYQRFELESQMESLESVRKARTSIFILFSRLLSIQKVCLLFFSRQIFVINFLAFAFEQKLTQLVFGIYKTFLIAASPEQIEATTQIAFSILTVLVSKLAYRKSKEILLTMLESINEAMINHPQINHLFANDCSIVFMAIPMISQSIQRKNSINIIEGVFNNLDQNESNRLQTQRRRRLTRSNTTNTISFDGAKTNDISLLNKKLIQEMIQFFALTASFYTITEEQVDILITTLLSFKDPNFVLDSYNRFIQLLAGDCLPSLKPCFIIRQPQILKLFIRVLIDSPKLHEILTFIYELCNFSLINIKVCIASELDLFLLDLLARDKNEEKFSHETVELILNLFSILSIRHSSNRAVYDYIGLIAMINPTTVYQHEQLLIDSLDSIINLSMNEPASTFALVHNNVMRFGIDPKFIGKKDLLLFVG
ncbi:hypothetical protein TRFO_01567 [Tritrichomonas foetus]|uniref:Uncharacterized protein n=1 Tax=Tritrichomonas foetus TaxID=1144522 RepID=A0A1J4JXH0_9EUKA|nr:hypothetical protein TRFO_01567 [Tritrichomonas foetus]|eukprot:OHT03847.1 hypothetical protein TRFO_01567 [Tritrichomonas foetus]